MYHHCLIKILVEFHLKNLGDNWEIFLVRNHFKEDNQEQPSSSKVKRGRKIKNEGRTKQVQKQS